ncbi:MAG: hypothetical protein ACREXT_12605 [Gammaproteobacteria bacterium]
MGTVGILGQKDSTPEPSKVQCGNCKNFMRDLVNPEAGIGTCEIAGEGSRGLLYPFRLHKCDDFAERDLIASDGGFVSMKEAQ